MLTVIREMAEAAEARAGGDARRGHRRGARRGGRERRAHPGDARGAARGGRRRRGRRRARGVLPRRGRRRAGRAHPRAARGDRAAAEPRGGAPGGVAVPLLHVVPARGRRHRPRPARDASCVAMGDCLLVVGEAPMCRVHLHTDDPGAALTQAVAMGSIDRVAIANMHEQTRQREERLRSAPTLVALPGGRPADDRLTAENTAIVLDSTADLPHPEREHAELADGAADRALRRGAVRGLGRDRAGRVLPAAAKRRPAPADRGAVAGRLPAHVRAARRLRPRRSSCRSPRASRRSVQAARIAADDPAAGGRVTVLDGHTVSVGTGMLADGVQRLLEAGTTVAEVDGMGGGRARAPAPRDLRRHARVPAPRRPHQPHPRAGGQHGRPASAADAARRRAGPLPPRRRRPQPGAARVRPVPVRARAGRRRRAGRARPRRRSRRGASGWRRPCAGCGRGPGSSGCASSAPWSARTAGRARSGCWCWRSVDQGVRGSRPCPPTGFPRPRSAPEPAHLREPATTRKPLATALARAAAAAGRDRGRPARAHAVPARGLPLDPHAGRDRPRRGGDRDLHGRAGAGAADAAAQPRHRRGGGARRVRPGRRHLVQPALPGQAAAAGHAALDPGRAPPDHRRRDRRQVLRAGRRRLRRRCTPRGSCPCTRRRRGSRAASCARSQTRCSDTPATRSTRCPTGPSSAARLPLRRDALTAAHRPDTQEQAVAGRSAARLRRALPAPARHARAPGAGSTRSPGRCRCRRRASSATRYRAALPVRADRRPGPRDRGDRRRRGPRPADAAAAAGRRRLGQDGGGRARARAGGRERGAGGADGADRDARDAAPDRALRPADPARRARGRAHAGHAGGRAPRSGCRGGRRRPARRRRHARADPGPGRVRHAAGGGRRRAAPVRRRAAAGARGEVAGGDRRRTSCT